MILILDKFYEQFYHVYQFGAIYNGKITLPFTDCIVLYCTNWRHPWNGTSSHMYMSFTWIDESIQIVISLVRWCIIVKLTSMLGGNAVRSQYPKIPISSRISSTNIHLIFCTCVLSKVLCSIIFSHRFWLAIKNVLSPLNTWILEYDQSIDSNKSCGSEIRRQIRLAIKPSLWIWIRSPISDFSKNAIMRRL